MHKRTINGTLLAIILILGACFVLRAAGGSGWTLVGWNNLGMHCMDSDYGVFSILPPYNTIQAQLMDATGKLIRAASQVNVTYEAQPDPAGSINTTSVNKTGFWQQVLNLFGVSLPPDFGLAGKNMPGVGNVPQAMTFDSSLNWFIAEGIPLTPYDDSGQKNYYPMMHLVARDGSGNILATTDIVLPVSDEMDCRACHASDSGPAARPASGWVHDSNPDRDYRLNILLLHDQLSSSSPDYGSALATSGYDPNGLYPTVVNQGISILCARCHASNALGTTGVKGVIPLTQAVHAYHAGVLDPTNGQSLDSSSNRSACYRCHPGSATRCLRGAMGNAVAADGSLAIQCQDCHGSIRAVGSPTRQGWLSEPSCQNCHTGNAVTNSGQIRFTNAFGPPDTPRTPADGTFATNPATPAAGFSLYRFSTGHGGLQCSACHHSTHAIYPSSHLNDNLQALKLQNHIGMLSECSTCHNAQPATTNGGPHGLHPMGQAWASSHGDAVERTGSSACQTCHGQDYRGTVLSRSLGDRNLSTRFGSKQFWRGFQVGCYSCHNGPRSENANPTAPPHVSDDSITAASGSSTPLQLKASASSGLPLQLRIVSQPAHGMVALTGTSATYFSTDGYAGPDSFTFAASDGTLDSNLGTISISVTGAFLFPFCRMNPSAYTGFAITNYSSASTNITFTLYGADGNVVPAVSNPSSYTLQPQTQLAKLAGEIFGLNAPESYSGWVRMTADNDGLGGFFQFGGTTQLDGSAAQVKISKHFRFTRVLEGSRAFRGQAAATYLSIANPAGEPVTLALSLYGSQAGQLLVPAVTKTIPALGLLYGTVSDIFGQNLSVSNAYVDVQVNTGEGAVGFEWVQFPDSQTVLGLNGVPEGDSSTAAYSAQLASNSSYFTSLKLINTGSTARSVTLRAVSDSGADIVPAVNLSLAPGQVLEQDIAEVLALPSGTTAVGSLILRADGSGVLGDVIFGDPGDMRFAASLPLQTREFRQAVFSQVANAGGYFTGLALFNPNQQSADVTVEVYTETGVKAGEFSTQLDANARISRLLTELVPASVGQMGGFVMLRSSLPIVAQQLFGDSGMAFLSAVPPTIIN